MLQRVRWLFAGDIDEVVRELVVHDVCIEPGRDGGEIRVRLVAFGRSREHGMHFIGHGHIVRTLMGFLSGLDDAFRPVQLHEPAPALLALLLKNGLGVVEREKA